MSKYQENNCNPVLPFKGFPRNKMPGEIRLPSRHVALCKSQGKLGGCTVISLHVSLNYTTYYLNLGTCSHNGWKATMS